MVQHHAGHQLIDLLIFQQAIVLILCRLQGLLLLCDGFLHRRHICNSVLHLLLLRCLRLQGSAQILVLIQSRENQKLHEKHHNQDAAQSL